MRTIKDVQDAVTKGWISVEQATRLIGRLLAGQAIDPEQCVLIRVYRD